MNHEKYIVLRVRMEKGSSYFENILQAEESKLQLKTNPFKEQIHVTYFSSFKQSLGALLGFLVIYLKLILTVNFCFIERDGEGIVETLKNYEDKIQKLERDLYFYKKTSRDLKKKLKELVGEAIRQQLVPSESKRFSITCCANTIAWFAMEPLPTDWIIQNSVSVTKIVVQSMCKTEPLDKRIKEQMYMCVGNDHLLDCLQCTRGSYIF